MIISKVISFHLDLNLFQFIIVVANKVAAKQPRLVSLCMTELENLITDPNRSVASLAISTLLKTCKEDQVEKLLKQISSYLPDLGIEFKIETI